MIEMYLLEQFDALVRCGTLTSASKELNLTQPTLTRSMKKLESEMGVPLFERRTGSIELNENGRFIARYAARMIELEREMVRRVRQLDRSRSTLIIGFSGSAPLLELATTVAESDAPSVTTEKADEGQLFAGLRDGRYQIIVLPHPIDTPHLVSVPVCRERLVCGFPEGHPMAKSDGVRFADLNGETLITFTDMGFWRDIIEDALPDSQVVALLSVERLQAIALSSSLPVLSTDVSKKHAVVRDDSIGRISVPVLDDEAQVEFYAVCDETELETNKNLAQLWSLLVKSVGQKK